MQRLAAGGERADAAIAGAAEVIRRGGTVIIPTDTLYGLAADPFNADAIERVFAVKGRAAGQALPLVAGSLEQVEQHLGILPPRARRLARRAWPGPLTILVPASAALAPAVSAGTGRVGIRVPAHSVARALCAACDRPLTATSANRSGEPPSANPDEVARGLKDAGVDALLDAGPTPGGPPSTIVGVDGTSVELVRTGAIPWNQILAWLEG
jgi:L-threonylcarbamoyladenylate synthase